MGLLAAFIVTVFDSSGNIATGGRWLKSHYGPEANILLIFLSSGILLHPDQIKRGLKDIRATVLALGVVFMISPLAAALLSLAPIETGIIIGVFLVAVMPPTLSSGVVMTGASGGNMAHALFVTVLANSMAIFTIPVVLSLLVHLIGGDAVVNIDKAGIMIKLTCFVILPLLVGIWIRRTFSDSLTRILPFLQPFNQFLIVIIVWMGLSQARSVIVGEGKTIGYIVVLSAVFHGILLAAAGLLVLWGKLERGRRESVIFMGAQKTLPLSIILQVTVFPQYGQALVFCVIHHLVHLLMDSYLVARLKIRVKGDS